MKYNASVSYVRNWKPHSLEGSVVVQDDGAIAGVLADGRHIAGCVVQADEGSAMALFELPLHQDGTATTYLLKKSGSLDGIYVGFRIRKPTIELERQLSYACIDAAYNQISTHSRNKHRAKMRLQPVPQ